jgi:virulence factor Mce-like protein
MKRLAGICLLLAVSGTLAVFATGASNGDGNPSYWVELDDAFGLVSGGDVKIAGVRAGTIGDMKVDQKTHRALVQIKITKTGFGSIRTDVSCQARPESLIGEYFLDCQPGTSPVELKPGSTIPVNRTSSVVAPDLVNDVLRRPYRERFSIIINELGAAVAGNAQNLNDAIRRASPGLQETDKVLAILAKQNHVLANLVKNADTVVGDLADNKAQVARWVQMADRTSAASAQRKQQIAQGFHLLPGFLEQLKPSMAQLGRVADEQGPALKTLGDSAGQLKTFFDRLGPFAKVSKPAFQALGKASVTGRQAVTAATPTVAELAKFSKGVPELGRNLSIILRHLDNRKFAAEPDPRSPGGKGYTGLEALLEYVYDQVLSVNIYDSSVHILKISPFPSPCADYADINRAIKTPGLIKQCGAALGPNQAGVNLPDTTRPASIPPTGPIPADKENAVSRHRHGDATARKKPALKLAPAKNDGAPAKHTVPTLSDVIPGAPPVVLPSPPAAVQQLTNTEREQTTQNKLLDYLLGG